MARGTARRSRATSRCGAPTSTSASWSRSAARVSKSSRATGATRSRAAGSPAAPSTHSPAQWPDRTARPRRRARTQRAAPWRGRAMPGGSGPKEARAAVADPEQRQRGEAVRVAELATAHHPLQLDRLEVRVHHVRLGCLAVRLALGEAGREEDVEGIGGVARCRVEPAQVLEPFGSQARLLTQFGSRELLGRAAPSGGPAALRELP